jgi:hypothetical protein
MYFSSNTIIYYLMRNEVDATELDDVYLEQSPEDVVESATVTTATTVASGSGAVTDVSGTPIAPVGTTAPVESAPPPAQSSEAPPA